MPKLYTDPIKLYASRRPPPSKRVFEIWCPEESEGPDEAREIHAEDAESAVRKWAKTEDRDDPPRIAAGDRLPLVHVREVGDTEVRRYRVSGWYVARYDT